ncbi:acyl-CoA dehydrogenase family protein [Pseudofrankia inefficax]|uniref:Acyl-CoA dehydrogenase domain-containing protein n=1 Tax=Pseudofrankia inefficax (strain DSM 45817 / CECT 9037 / DDB 130130 / EuI1c) TaxID=298654 RepID=E3IU51_PSEI1|nr:acyl-CoA dehydrogenase family protein [Pseudofrankia inefficax]ADP81244.1 acyl-CoA dehydrogenase domain-containing protein [Pseudofrankia inefficax]
MIAPEQGEDLDFAVGEEFAAKLRWADEFVSTEVEPLDQVLGHPCDLADPRRAALVPPLQRQVREAGLWACHLGPELGGPGYGQVRLGLLNEILGRSRCAPVVFGCQAPDSGNAEILARFGTAEHQRRYLRPLLDNEIVSCFSMTEPQGGSDPTEFTLRAEPDGDEWVLNGEKWFSSNAAFAAFALVLAVTEPDARRHRRLSMFIVPTATPGFEIIRNVANYGDLPGTGTHSYVRYDNVRIPGANLLGERGGGFVVAQVRLGGGRVHHAMRSVGLVRRALDMMCERALSRRSGGRLLADTQLVQAMIADTWLQIEQFRLLVLRTAARIDRYQDYNRVRTDIAAVKIALPTVVHDVAARAVQLHGSLGISDELPLARWVLDSFYLGLADGATDIHRMNLGRLVLREHEAHDGLFPTGHLPRLRAEALAKYTAEVPDLLLVDER